MVAKKKGEFLDFTTIKEQTSVLTLLAHYDLLQHMNVEKDNDEISGTCPFGDEHGKEDSFSFNVEKKLFKCFACKKRGSVIDFVKYMESTEDHKVNIKEASGLLNRINKEAESLSPRLSNGDADQVAEIYVKRELSLADELDPGGKKKSNAPESSALDLEIVKSALFVLKRTVLDQSVVADNDHQEACQNLHQIIMTYAKYVNTLAEFEAQTK